MLVSVNFFFSKLTFSKILSGVYQCHNSLEPGQVRQLVGSHLLAHISALTIATLLSIKVYVNAFLTFYFIHN